MRLNLGDALPYGQAWAAAYTPCNGKTAEVVQYDLLISLDRRIAQPIYYFGAGQFPIVSKYSGAERFPISSKKPAVKLALGASLGSPLWCPRPLLGGMRVRMSRVIRPYVRDGSELLEALSVIESYVCRNIIFLYRAVDESLA